ncbi:hypothetical protein COCON_G00180310 [Conger conger]|uniref:Uncharacterized protein n=1 Tax=Conger conger TaxID=82655 RepID=A0A9Q1HT16_CONCO|nr:hypothetical protein COCON_G00180310 [Conger conger]
MSLCVFCPDEAEWEFPAVSSLTSGPGPGQTLLPQAPPGRKLSPQRRKEACVQPTLRWPSPHSPSPDIIPHWSTDVLLLNLIPGRNLQCRHGTGEKNGTCYPSEEGVHTVKFTRRYQPTKTGTGNEEAVYSRATVPHVAPPAPGRPSPSPPLSSVRYRENA